MTALLAEDNDRVALLAERILRPICDQIIKINSYQGIFNAVLKMDRLEIAALDVFLTDGEMPECLEAIKYIRAKYPGCVIMVWSGHVHNVEEQLIAAGADGFIPKGANFSVDDVYNLLLEAFNKRSDDRRNPRQNLDQNLQAMEKVLQLKNQK